jgi:class 3 adenylate cyclase
MAGQIEAQLAQSRPPLDLRALEAIPAVASPLPPAPALPSALPAGTVTFLLTDIEGSTILWEKAGDAFRSALSSHHALLRREFRRQGGHEVKEAGDSFLVVFASVADALACAICRCAWRCTPAMWSWKRENTMASSCTMLRECLRRRMAGRFCARRRPPVC